MGHLDSKELVDLAEGVRPEASTPHLRSCERCRRRLAELRAALEVVDRIDVPEPSPLFWDHFSSRVREAIAAEGSPRGASALSWWMRPRAMVYAAGACAVALAAVVSLRLGDMRKLGAPAPHVESAAVKALEADPVAFPDDPSLDLVAELAAEIDWEVMYELGLETHGTMADMALRQLTTGERLELQRLLNEVLGRGGA